MSDLSNIIAIPRKALPGSAAPAPYEQLDVRYDRDQQALYFNMAAQPRPCFNSGLVHDILHFQEATRAQFQVDPLRHLILGSKGPGAFSYGGDLALFRDLIQRQDTAALSRYAADCATILDNHHRALDLPLVTVALVQGDAIGAGFETVLATDVVILERGIKLGFPEILFNLVPGHGALHLLSHYLGPRAAREMILGGKLYSADEIHAMGLADMVVDTGAGPAALAEYLRRSNASWNAHSALHRINRTTMRMSGAQLRESAAIWVEAAMQLGPRQLRMMDRLVRAQSRPAAPETMQHAATPSDDAASPAAAGM